MVAPIYIIAIALGLAFAMGLFGKSLGKISGALLISGLAALTFISGQWLWNFMMNHAATEIIYTAGFKPPFAIVLQMGMAEAMLTFMINVAGLLGAIYLFDVLHEKGNNAMMVYLLFIMSTNVSVMTLDIFNLFVFLEIESIALAGLILLVSKGDAFQAGMKYLIISGITA